MLKRLTASRLLPALYASRALQSNRKQQNAPLRMRLSECISQKQMWKTTNQRRAACVVNQAPEWIAVSYVGLLTELRELPRLLTQPGFNLWRHPGRERR